MQKIVEVPGVGNVEFPDSMSDADIGTVIQKQHPELISANYGGKSLEQRQAESKASADANAVPWYVGMFNRWNPSTPKSQALSKAGELAAEVPTGVQGAVTGLPAAAGGATDALWQAVRHGDLAPAERMATAITNPVMTPLKQAVELLRPGLVNAPSPDAPETIAAAQGAGNLLGSAMAGMAIEPLIAAGSKLNVDVGAVIGKVAGKLTTADAMKLRAMANRAPASPLTVADAARDAVTTGVGGFVGGPAGAAAVETANLIRRTPLYRTPKAIAQEWLAGKIAGPQGASGNAVVQPADVAMGPVETVAAPRSAGESTAQPPPLPREPLTAETVGIQRPNAPELTPENLSVWDQIRGRYGEPPPAAPDAPAINKWMGIKPDEVSHGANPGQRLLDEKLIGATKEATAENVKSALDDATKAMKSRLKAATDEGIKIDAQTPVYDAKALVNKRIGSPKDAAFQSQVQSVVDDIEGKYPDLGRLTPEQTHALKVELGDSINWKGAAYDDPINKMMIQIYRDLNSAIKTNVEGIGPAQARWGDLYISSKGLRSGMAKDVVGKGTGAQPGPAK